MIIDAEVYGIPCLVEVTRYVAPTAPVVCGAVDEADPGYPGEVEFNVLDRRGRPAPWLDRLVDDDDRCVIEQRVIGLMEEHAGVAL